MVNRYDIGWTRMDGVVEGCLVSSTTGDWVGYTDYAELEAKLAKAERVVDVLGDCLGSEKLFWEMPNEALAKLSEVMLEYCGEEPSDG